MKAFRAIFLIITSILFLSCYIVTPLKPPRIVPTSTRADPLGIRDGGLITEQPCGPPCYQDIQLGMSVDEGISIIRARGMDSVCTINPTNISCGLIHTFIYYDENNSIIQQIHFDPINIIVEDVFTKYGRPDWYDVESNLDEVGQPNGSYFMILYYDDLKMHIHLESQEQPTVYTLTPQTMVISVYYEEPFWQDLHLQNDWHGYGDYY